MSELTRDSFLDGRLIVSQPRRGYRFSIDAVLLAAAVAPQPGDRMLELGTGCGIIALLLAYRLPQLRIQAVEIQPELAAIAARNVTDNHLQAQIAITRCDLRSLPSESIPGPFDWVIANPPFRTSGSGRINPDPQRALARHEIAVDLAQLTACAGRMLPSGGEWATIFPAERTVELLESMRQAAIEPSRLQPVYSHEGEDAKLVLVQGIKKGHSGLRILPPLVIYTAEGRYTEAVERMMMP